MARHRPKVLIIDEPTRGIDVGTKAEVHRLLSELAAEGLAVLMISSDLPEILGMADRVLVMHEGRLTAEIPRAEATEETVMAAATRRTADDGDRPAASRPDASSGRAEPPVQPPGASTASSGCASSPSCSSSW